MPIILVYVLIISGIFVSANVADKILEKQIQQGSQPTLTVIKEVQTATPSPTSTPTPIPVPQVKINPISPTPYDPIVDCGSDWQKQNGKTTKLQKSICDSWSDCNINDKVVRMSKQMCIDYQAKANIVNCQLGDQWTKMNKDDCTKAQNARGSKIQSQQNDVENAMRTLAGLDAESWGAKNLDQLDNIRERVRQVQSSDPSVQEYANQIISFIEERIKQAQGL